MEKHTGSPSSPVTFNYHCRQVAANITNHSVYLTRKCFWNLRWNSMTPVLGQCVARTVGCPFALMDDVADASCGVELGMLGSEGSSPPLTGEDFVPGTQESGTYKVEPCLTWGLPHCGDTMLGSRGCIIVTEFLLH